MAKLNRTLTPAEVQLVRDIAHETVSWQWSTERGNPIRVEAALRTIIDAERQPDARPTWANRHDAMFRELPIRWTPSPLELNLGFMRPGNIHFDAHESRFDLFVPHRIAENIAQNHYISRVEGIVNREMNLPNSILNSVATEMANLGLNQYFTAINLVDSQFSSFEWRDYLSQSVLLRHVKILNTLNLYNPSQFALMRALVALETGPRGDELRPYIEAWETVYRYTFGLSIMPNGINVSRRPTLVRVNQQQLHSAEGRAIEFENGWGFDAWRGTVVPAWKWTEIWNRLAEAQGGSHGQNITLAMMDRIGWATLFRGGYLRDSTRLSSVDDPGNPGGTLETWTLWPAGWGAAAWAQARTFLVCTNGTAEPDGSHRQYGLQIPFDLRHDPVAAAAWCYGVTRKQYKEIARRT